MEDKLVEESQVKVYVKPEIIYETVLEARAGSPITESVNPLDLLNP